MRFLAIYTPLLEKIFLVGLLIGALFGLLEIEPFNITVTMVSLFGLAIAYYVAAFRPMETPEDGSGQMGFKELLAYIIVPKVFWISSGVSLIGLGLLTMGSDTNGYKQMLMIGGITIATGMLVIMVLVIGGARILRPVSTALLRAIPLMIVDIFFLTR